MPLSYGLVHFLRQTLVFYTKNIVYNIKVESKKNIRASCYCIIISWIIDLQCKLMHSKHFWKILVYLKRIFIIGI